MVKFFYLYSLTKSGLGYILGEFVTNSSGHPDDSIDLLESVPSSSSFLGGTEAPVPAKKV
jgi:hypothetical protein